MERAVEEIRLLSEYVDAAPRPEGEFLRLHAEMLLSFVRDAIRAQAKIRVDEEMDRAA